MSLSYPDFSGIDFRAMLTDRTHSAVVYYLVIGDRVKIGTTTNLGQRVRSLSLRLADVYRVEPGGITLERARHAQFSSHRVAVDREWFWLRGDLLDFLGDPTPAAAVTVRARADRTAFVPADVAGAPLMTLAELAASGLVPIRYGTLRSLKSRHRSFPEALGKRGERDVYRPAEIADWWAARTAAS
jgi:hypothetical protein